MKGRSCNLLGGWEAEWIEKASKLEAVPLLVAKRGVKPRMVDVDESEENDRSDVEAREQPEKETLRMCRSRGLDPRR